MADSRMSCAALQARAQDAQMAKQMRDKPDEQTRGLLTYADKLLAAFDKSSITQPLPTISHPQSAIGHLVEPLSERELEVLRLVAAGASNREIAQRLVITLSTTERHVANILSKLALRSRTEIALWAVAHGLGVPATDG